MESGSKDESKQSRVDGAVSSVRLGAVNVLGFTGAVIFSVLIILFAIGVPLAMMIIGSNNKDECPIEKHIPIYLIVAGALGLIMVPLSAVCGACIKCLPSDSGMAGCLSCLNGLFFVSLSFFSFAWFIAGNVWVFRNYEPNYSSSPDQSKYCDETTYKVAFWVIIATYIASILSCLLSGCFARKATYDELE